jgi:hypothetical protein
VKDEKADDIVQTLFIALALPLSVLLFALSFMIYLMR